jgi:hypothetical protein
MPTSFARLAACLPLLAPLPAAAQGTQVDAALAYSAREEVPDPDGGDLDNDILRLTAGVAWGLGDGRVRGALEFGGMNNADWGTDFDTIWGGELAYARRVGNQRYALGGRVRNAEPLSTTTELMYAAQHLGATVDLRGVAGAQFVADSDDVPGRDDDAGLFALGEVTTYLGSDFAVSGGLYIDPDGSVGSFGAEWQPAGRAFSLFFDYAASLEDYRATDGFDDYDKLTGGIRIVFGGGDLRTNRQDNLARVFHRPVEVQ